MIAKYYPLFTSKTIIFCQPHSFRFQPFWCLEPHPTIPSTALIFILLSASSSSLLTRFGLQRFRYTCSTVLKSYQPRSWSTSALLHACTVCKELQLQWRPPSLRLGWSSLGKLTDCASNCMGHFADLPQFCKPSLVLSWPGVQFPSYWPEQWDENWFSIW